MILKNILIVFFFVSLKVYSQKNPDLKASQEIDSLIKKDQWDLVDFRLGNENINFKRISKYNLKYDLLIKLDSASVLYQKGEFAEAERSVLHSLELIQENKKNLDFSYYEALRHIAITRLFYVEKRKGNITQGLKYLNDLSKGMSPVYKKKQEIFFAVAYIELRNYKKGIDLLNTRLNDIRNDTDNILYAKFLKVKEIATTYNTKSDAFIKWYKDTGETKFLDSAQYNYEKAYQLMKDSPAFSAYSRALHTCRKANTTLLKKQYALSLSLFNECEKDPVLMQKNFSREAVWLGKAEVYTFLKKNDSAFQYLKKLDNVIKDAKCTYETKLKVYHLLSINYENLGNSKEAYKYAKLSLSEIEKENIQKNSGNVFLGIYEQQEIKNISEEMLTRNNKKNFLIIACLLFMGIIFYVVYSYNRKKKGVLGIRENDKNMDILPVAGKKSVAVPVIEDELISNILVKLESLESKKRFLSNNFKLVNIAKQLNTNTAYLSQIINQHKEVSFSEYVNNLRINYILNELEMNPQLRKYTIQTISEEIGYKSSTTFTKAFKERTGMTPSDYIRQLEKNSFEG
ncbi:helix-turn-helix domain-containing protein [Chryseobacterium shigense]|uniref:AraC-like DNA-binding protein n=1 Tax=Chryseobacterium shigense TaxID=297244 RepID=A0A841N3W8_9FLAO|nr:helix-turn-helix transcriptional regulator [Chryseobacterium shigense]MBB6371137.1 AraC-like DNA-binding protein [Chryseobacterium shigense]